MVEASIVAIRAAIVHEVSSEIVCEISPVRRDSWVKREKALSTYIALVNTRRRTLGADPFGGQR